MPIYEYECGQCGHRFERMQKFSDPRVRKCPECGRRRVQRLISPPSIHFKGSGWYVTDYAKKDKPADMAEATEEKKKEEKKKDAASPKKTEKSKDSGSSKKSA